MCRCGTAKEWDSHSVGEGEKLMEKRYALETKMGNVDERDMEECGRVS